MKLDGTISNFWVGVIFLIGFVIGANWIEARRNPPPPTDKYRWDGGTPWVAIWNMFDERVFTPQAIEFHRRRLKALPVVIAAFVIGWVLLDSIW